MSALRLTNVGDAPYHLSGVDFPMHFLRFLIGPATTGASPVCLLHACLLVCLSAPQATTTTHSRTLPGLLRILRPRPAACSPSLSASSALLDRVQSAFNPHRPRPSQTPAPSFKSPPKELLQVESPFRQLSSAADFRRAAGLVRRTRKRPFRCRAFWSGVRGR